MAREPWMRYEVSHGTRLREPAASNAPSCVDRARFYALASRQSKGPCGASQMPALDSVPSAKRSGARWRIRYGNTKPEVDALSLTSGQASPLQGTK